MTFDSIRRPACEPWRVLVQRRNAVRGYPVPFGRAAGYSEIHGSRY